MSIPRENQDATHYTVSYRTTTPHAPPTQRVTPQGGDVPGGWCVGVIVAAAKRGSATQSGFVSSPV